MEALEGKYLPATVAASFPFTSTLTVTDGIGQGHFIILCSQESTSPFFGDQTRLLQQKEKLAMGNREAFTHI